MSATAWIIVLWLAFAATHIGMSSVAARPRLVERLGLGPYMGLYSLVSLAIFVPLVWIYVANRHAGAMLWDLRGVPGLVTVSMLISGASFAMAVASFFQPSPNMMGVDSVVRAHGLTRITRHPLFLPFAFLGVAHLLLSGHASDVAFFGGLVIFSVVGCAHQDARKRATEGERLAEYFAESSLFPFAAVLSGRTRLVASELPWVGLAVGVAAAVGFYHLHWVMFF